MLREAERSTERLEQAALQKDLENREKSDQLADSKSELVTTLKELEEVRKERKAEVEGLKEELVGVQREVEKRKGEVDEMRKEVGLLKDERRNLSAGSVSERENNERERREMAAQFEKGIQNHHLLFYFILFYFFVVLLNIYSFTKIRKNSTRIRSHQSNQSTRDKIQEATAGH